MAAMASSQLESDVARCSVESFDGRTLVLSFPRTSYQVHLSATGSFTPGKRVRGRITARALRMHRAEAGGRFIEPVYGHPRIVQGGVIEIDGPGNRVLLDAGVPMWMKVEPTQSALDFKPGDLLNFYVESGATFIAE
jgi:hypothetical protein